MANLQLKTVSKIYPSGVLALYKASFQLSDSEFVAVVGGEKCGKSTLLRVIAGIEELSEGEVFIADKDVTKVETRDRDITMIFQGNMLYPSLTVADNISYGLKIRKASAALIEQRVKVASELLGLNDVLYRKPKALTTEQKQKVCFARAIVREPQIYLLDDPIAGISPDLRAQLRSVLINLQMRMKGTFLYATKNVNEALTMATRIIVLREGMIQQIDTPANLYDYPANAYVSFIIGSPSINFINDAAIVKDESGVYAQSKGVKLALPESIIKRFDRLEEYANTDKKVIIGLRPEDIKADKEGFMQATVSAIEEIAGTEYAQCDGALTFVVTANGAQKGDSVSLNADMKHVYIFDGVSRLTLLSRDEGYRKTDYADADFVPLPFDEEEEIKRKLKQPVQKAGKKK